MCNGVSTLLFIVIRKLQIKSLTLLSLNHKDLEKERRALFKTPEKSTAGLDEGMKEGADSTVLPTPAKRILSPSVASHDSTSSKGKSSDSQSLD